MSKNIIKCTLGSVALVATLAVVLSACSDDPAATTTTYTQVERLGRPAINEGLVLSNDYLIAFNSIAPSIDLTTAAADVVTQAGTVLGLVHTVALAASLSPAATADVVGGFLPDVMRIDTGSADPVWGSITGRNQASANASAKYNTVATGTGISGHPAILAGGRKLTDDVVNITLGYLFDGNPTDWFTGSKPYDDGVDYYGAGVTACSGGGSAPGTNPAAPGHKCLHGQTTPYGAATWPFLADAN
jgi:hypothetical protein